MNQNYSRPIVDKSNGRYRYNINIPKWKMLEDMDRFYVYTYDHIEEGRMVKYLYQIEQTGGIIDCIMWDGPELKDSYDGAEPMDFFIATWEDKIERKEIVKLNESEKAKMLLLWNERDGLI